MDEGVRTDIAVIKEKMQNITDQFKRFMSHLESEQRVTNNISKRMDTLEHTLGRIQDEKIKSDTNSKWKTETIISLISIVVSFATVLIMLFKN